MAVSTRMSVDSSGFKQGIDQARASLKTLDAALKTNEASFKAGGNAEIYMQQKTQLLNDKMTKQRDLVTMLQGKMEKMKAAGVSPLSTEYQRLETQMLNAQTSMLETKTTIDELDSSQQNATNSAEQLSNEVGGIGKKMSLDQVISGINAITEAMKNAARQVVEFGSEMWNQITDTASTADDLATMAVTFGIDTETLQKQKKVFDTMADTSIDAYYKARMKINKAINNPTEEQLGYLEALGLVTPTYDSVNLLVKDAEAALWAAGGRLREKVESGELSRDDADLWAQALFGKGFAELNPLFAMGRDAFYETSDSMSAATDDVVTNAANLNDSIILMQENFETLKLQVLGEIAPSLQEVTDSISDLINKLIEYAQSEEGQALLQSMAESISSMLSGLTEIDPQEVINKFTGIFDTIKEGFTWITDHQDDIKNALLVIAGGFAALKVSEPVLTFVKMANGLYTLFGGNNAASNAASNAATTAGSGLTLSRMGTWATNLLGGIAQHIPSTMAVGNAVPVFDWFWNNTLPGQVTRNTGDLGEGIRQGWESAKKTISDNIKSFADDWRGVFQNVFTDPNKQASKNLLFDPEQLQKEIEALTPQVEVETDPTVPSGAAQDIARQVGTVTVPARLSIMGGLIGLGGGGANLQNLANNNKMLYSNATGMPYVPFDGYLTMLHRGERVLTEGENRDYSPMLNRRVAIDDNQGSGRMVDITLMIGPERLTEVLVPLVDNGLGEIVALNRR